MSKTFFSVEPTTTLKDFARIDLAAHPQGAMKSYLLAHSTPSLRLTTSLTESSICVGTTELSTAASRSLSNPQAACGGGG